MQSTHILTIIKKLELFCLWDVPQTNQTQLSAWPSWVLRLVYIPRLYSINMTRVKLSQHRGFKEAGLHVFDLGLCSVLGSWNTFGFPWSEVLFLVLCIDSSWCLKLKFSVTSLICFPSCLFHPLGKVNKHHFCLALSGWKSLVFWWLHGVFF